MMPEKNKWNDSGIRPITDQEFERFRKLIYEKAGIHMAPEKKVLVSGRLTKRLRHYGLTTFGDYFRLATNAAEHPQEQQMLVDLLTTNETYFFREPAHFDFLQQLLTEYPPAGSLRVWSAACSSGEEVYTLAMILAETLSGYDNWEILGSDISTRMLDACRRAVYPMTRKGPMSDYYLHKYCLKGVREQAGNFLIDRNLRRRCSFQQVNLMQPSSSLGQFDVIFLRNVMIYFNTEGKRQAVHNLLQHLKPGGFLFVSHSESLHGVTDQLTMLRPSVYRKLR